MRGGLYDLIVPKLNTLIGATQWNQDGRGSHSLINGRLNGLDLLHSCRLSVDPS